MFKLIKEKKRTRSRFSEAEVLHLMHQLINGLAHMHKHGYFHRDIKPENLLYDERRYELAVCAVHCALCAVCCVRFMCCVCCVHCMRCVRCARLIHVSAQSRDQDR
jgi:serine/threonine protein kinase